MDLQTKICKICGSPKSLDQFRIYKIKYRVSECSECERKRARENRKNRYRNNKEREKILVQNQRWRDANPEWTKQKLAKQNEKYALDEDFREKRKEQTRKWRKNNPERKKETSAAWFQRNKSRLQEEWNHKFRTDPAFRLRNNLRHAIWEALRAGGGNKAGRSILKFLPYSMEELRLHLESLWEPWMTWDNYGVLESDRRTWQIDHVVPQVKLLFNDFSHPNFLKCWRLANLRPVESRLNLEKGCKMPERRPILCPPDFRGFPTFECPRCGILEHAQSKETLVPHSMEDCDHIIARQIMTN